MRSKKLLLFDVDHTLLEAGRLVRTAMKKTLQDLVGDVGAVDSLRMSGLTDPKILRELLKSTFCFGKITQDLIDQACHLYSENIKHYIGMFDVRPCVGVRELLDVLLAEEELLLGLQTGNLQPVAMTKLEAADLDPKAFSIGVFGSDSEDRRIYHAIASRRLREATGLNLSGRDIVFVGDTPYDIYAAQSGGCAAIGVATGSYDKQQLRDCSPDWVLPNLGDPQEFMSALNGL